MGDDAYCELQEVRDSEYERAWDDAPQSFRDRAASRGLAAHTEPRTGMVLAYDENLSRVAHPGHTPSFYIPDMANTIDTHIDRLVEKYGAANEKLIRAVADDLKAPMQEEIEKNRALMLGRVVMYLIKSESNNILARCHGLMHAIPRLAVISGFGSMRKSSKACGVSCEWIRRTRDAWCDRLGIPIPADGRKTDEARLKYHNNGVNNHWRKQTVPKPNQTTPCPIPTTNSHPPIHRPIPVAA